MVHLVCSDLVYQGDCPALVTSDRLSTWIHLQLRSPRERDWNLAKQKGTVITLLCIFRGHTHHCELCMKVSELFGSKRLFPYERVLYCTVGAR